MSLAVFLIAAIPAVAVTGVAYYSKRRSITLISAAAASALGVATGNPAYAALDVGAVIIATLLVWPDLRTAAESRRSARMAAKQARQIAKKSKNDQTNTYIKLILIFSAMGMIALFIGAVYFAEQFAKNSATAP